MILVVVNFDPANPQKGWVRLDLGVLGVPDGSAFVVHDLLTDERFLWHGASNYVELVPDRAQAHVFEVRWPIPIDMAP